jgi:hypothetical protein
VTNIMLYRSRPSSDIVHFYMRVQTSQKICSLWTLKMEAACSYRCVCILLQDFNYIMLRNQLFHMDKALVHVTLPRFSSDSTAKLEDTLQAVSPWQGSGPRHFTQVQFRLHSKVWGYSAGGKSLTRLWPTSHYPGSVSTTQQSLRTLYRR